MSDDDDKPARQHPSRDDKKPAADTQPKIAAPRPPSASGGSSTDKARARAEATDATIEGAEAGPKRRRWPSVLLVLIAVGSAAAWYAPSTVASWSRSAAQYWPEALTLPMTGSTSGKTPSQAAVRPADKVAAKPTSETSAEKPVANAAALERRIASLEERLASATSQMQSDRRTIDQLQGKIGEGERQAKALLQRIEVLDKEAADLRQAMRDTPRSAQQASAVSPAMPAPPRAAPDTGVPTLAAVPPATAEQRRAPSKAAAAGVAPIRPQAPPTGPAAAGAQKAAATSADGSGCAGLVARYPKPVLLQFGRNQDVLQADHQKRLAELSKAVAPCANVTLAIRGFTDARGSEKRNGDLSRKRADLAARYIEQRGVKREQLTVSGLSATAPLAPNDTEQGRARNRRVEVVVQVGR